MDDQPPPRSQLHGAARVVGLILAAALALVTAWTALQSGDVPAAIVEVEHAADLVEQAATPEPADVAGDSDTDTDGAR